MDDAKRNYKEAVSLLSLEGRELDEELRQMELFFHELKNEQNARESARLAGVTNVRSENTSTEPWFLDLTGWRADQVAGMEWWRAVAPEDRERFSAAFFAATESEGNLDIQYIGMTNNRKRLKVRMLSEPLYDEAGEYDGQALSIYLP